MQSAQKGWPQPGASELEDASFDAAHTISCNRVQGLGGGLGLGGWCRVYEGNAQEGVVEDLWRPCVDWPCERCRQSPVTVQKDEGISAMRECKEIEVRKSVPGRERPGCPFGKMQPQQSAGHSRMGFLNKHIKPSAQHMYPGPCPKAGV